jgi:RNA polymerase sigma factor (sigma-70 family)
MVHSTVRDTPIDFFLFHDLFCADSSSSAGRQRRRASALGIPRRAMTTLISSGAVAELDRRCSALMVAAQAGNGAAYEELLRQCVPFVKNIARGRSIAADRIDDVVQDVLLTIHRARHTYDPTRPFTAWLRVITDRRAIDLIRRIRRNERREVHAPLAFENHADETADPTRGIAQADERANVSRVLETLPMRQREAIQYLVLEEHSLADTAVLTRRSKVSLKVNLHRALKALRGRLERAE